VSGNGIIVLTAAAIAVWAGIAWERARNAVYLVRRTKGSLGTLRGNARKAQGHAVLWVGLAILMIYYLARHS